ncbi:2-isopropylmalate synthase [Acetobacterium paludosum]|uniref:2-isopropylmalate synthase n=1 Tax=Acetobacterium paludosum TaxID=52693 RepID=A0A923KSE7_9FIRM|nr:2-isopropylmalate synthase [Acetobacterium paludosum]MBC3888292.1 2-isopropylmalate synthase [Acetobacterium paludosum]
MSRTIKIFDTTLRDGEQSPGCSMNLKEKLEMAKQLERLNVDIIEAGFAIASPGDFESVKLVANEIRDVTIASLARSTEKDITAAHEALKGAANPRLHYFLATSDIHMEYKLRMSPEEVLAQAIAMARFARNIFGEIEFSAEDASRTRPEFLYRILEGVINEGVTIVNVPDTVGYATPEEHFKFIEGIRNNVPNIDKATISVHVHNDLGLGVANTLAAIQAGAGQVECTVNGIGERAGNAALEEIVMALKTRKDIYQVETNIKTTEIYRSSRLLTKLTGVKVQPNKAIVGENAFAHEAGIHQHGMMANKETYEIMTPESIGLKETKMVLGKHSGKHAFVEKLDSLGYNNFTAEEVIEIFEQFKVLADKKKDISDKDILALVEQKQLAIPEVYSLDRFIISTGNTISTAATIRLRKNGNLIEGVSLADGPISAGFKAISELVEYELTLIDYGVEAVTDGTDAQGEAHVKISDGTHVYHGRGLSTDIIDASLKAYVDAVNQMLYIKETEDQNRSNA